MIKKRLSLQLASWLLYAIVRLLIPTYRIRFEGMEHRQTAANGHPNGSFALALWHEQLFAAILAHRGQRIAPLASLSSDGDLVTFVLDRLGYRTIRGSSSKRGEEARDDLVEMTKAGWFAAITVDGPRGPRRRVKGGIVDVARRTQVNILPIVAVADRQWILRKSWDQFKIPKPFSRIVIRYGAPLIVPEDTKGLAFGTLKASLKTGLENTETLAIASLSQPS